MADKRCISCSRSIINDTASTSFKCPKCGSEEIVRCAMCRKTGVHYKCSGCQFEGP